MVGGKSSRRGYRGGSRYRGGYQDRGRGYGMGRGRGDVASLDMLDFQVQVWPENERYEPNYGAMTRGWGSRGYRGSRGPGPSRTGTPSNSRGRGGGSPQVRPSTPSRGNGIFHARASTPSRGWAPQYRGRGHAGLGSPNQSTKHQSKLGIDSPLSSLLHETRPLLRPIVFIKSQMTPYLFQQEEELLQPAAEDSGDVEESHIPTAERVAQVFDGSNSFDARSDDDEEIEEIDFNDTEKLLEVQAKPVKKYTMPSEKHLTGYSKPAAHRSTPSTQTVVDVQGYEDRATTQSNVDVVEGIAEMIINSRPEIGEMATQRQQTADTIDSQDTRSFPLETQRPKGSVSQAAIINDNSESVSIETVRKDVSASLPAAHGVVKMDLGVELQPSDAASFFIDTVPSQISFSSQSRGETTTSQILGVPTVPPDDDDIIVYVAPHPRTGRSTPAIPITDEPPPILPSVSMLTGLPTISESASSSDPKLETLLATPTSSFAKARKPRQFVSPLLLANPSTHRKAKARVLMQEARIARRRKGKSTMFSLAAQRQEKEWQELEGLDPRWEERRRGDSDIDWGDEDKDRKNQEDAAMKPESGADGMEVDVELLDERNISALESFADGMLGQEQSRFVTMDDIADVENLNQEDEASAGGAEGSSDDESSEEDQEVMNAVLAKEEEKMMGEAEDRVPSEDDEDSEDEDSDEDELDPRSSFQARLERLRAMKKRVETSGDVDMSYWMDLNDDDEDDDEDQFDMNFAWTEGDSIDQIQGIVDENESILTHHDRKAKKKMFKAINNGDYVDLYSFTVAKRKKDRPTDLSIELQEQREKDRAKKAQRKAARKLEKLKAAADPLAKKKGGKKGRKAMLAAASLDPAITSIGPNRIIDTTTLVQQIVRFLQDRSRQSMALPPADKYCRKLTHEVANAFGLKSQSKGHADERYTTLTRTSRSGLFVDERKLEQILRRSSKRNIFVKGVDGNGNGNGNKGSLRHKEGDEVGKAAPKIGSSNVGFKMLEAMGWSEGDRIGVTGGLDQPLTAIIKHSKLGLGATRQ